MIIRIVLLFAVIFSSCGHVHNNETIQKDVSKDTSKLDFYDRARLLALGENKIGQEYVFTVKQDTGINSLSVVYLGNIKMKNGKNIKLLNSVFYYSLTNTVKHSSAAVWLYDNNNTILGNYYVGSDGDLPSRIENGDLIFAFNDSASCNQTTRINFQDSIPNEIFVNCTEKGGNLYNFQSINETNNITKHHD